MGKRRSSPLNKLSVWIRSQSMKVKAFMAVTVMLCSFVGLKLFVKNDSYIFIAAEAVHALGIMVLIYKLTTQKTCSGLSLKSQEITALFLAIRLYSSFIFEADIHIVLDSLTLLSTLWVIYMIRFKLKSTYNKESDDLPLYFVVIPCAILALFVHPFTQHYPVNRMLWAFGVYAESVSILPQLRLMQNAKMVEPFTAHYVFALGVQRFLGCAYWIIRVIDTGGTYLFLIGAGNIWILMMFLAEIIQTFILADFCYYYVKSVVEGQLLVKFSPPV